MLNTASTVFCTCTCTVLYCTVLYCTVLYCTVLVHVFTWVHTEKWVRYIYIRFLWPLEMPHVSRRDLGREMDGKRWKNGNLGQETGKWDGIRCQFPVFPSTSRFSSNQCMVPAHMRCRPVLSASGLPRELYLDFGFSCSRCARLDWHRHVARSIANRCRPVLPAIVANQANFICILVSAAPAVLGLASPCCPFKS
jgi:hypothetical protein